MWPVGALYPFLEITLFSRQATQSGGIGAVSAGISESVLLPVLGVVPSIAINRWFATRTRVMADWDRSTVSIRFFCSSSHPVSRSSFSRCSLARSFRCLGFLWWLS